VPREHKAVVSNTNLKLDMVANRTVDSDPGISLLFAFTNNTAQPVSELHFQLAVTKVTNLFKYPNPDHVPRLLITAVGWQGYELLLKPQSGRTLAPKQSRGVTQSIKVCHAGDQAKKVEAIKLRWRVAYKVGGELKQEMGEIPEFTVA
jgi:hypothetical protein